MSQYVFRAEKGLSESIVKEISRQKKEPEWMWEFRRRAFEVFNRKKMPAWGADLSGVDFDDIYYYLKPTEGVKRRWEDVPKEIRETYERIGIPRAEQELLAGVSAQYESEVIYGSLLQSLRSQGVVFLSMDEALKSHPDLVKQYFGTLVPPTDNKFAALNSAVWSGGSFVYVPKDVKVELPLQAYFRINAPNMGQFERTLIIADEGSDVHYTEGCTAPLYSGASLHAAVVEIFVKKSARVRYSTVQNWSKNVYNLVTKRARVEEDGSMSWVDGNLGSKVTMKYPSCVLAGRRAKGEVLSLNFAGKGQVLDTGGKMIHLAPNTSGAITSKSLSKDSGHSAYRGLIQIQKGAGGAKSKVRCDSLILDEESRADTFPHIKIAENDVEATHEATTGKLNEDQLFYLQSRGLDRAAAEALLIHGFVDPVVKELPMEYAVELNRLLELEMEGAVG